MDGDELKRTVLELVAEEAEKTPFPQTGAILPKAANLLGINGQRDSERALLTFWNDLFRTGYLSWGSDLSNPNPPFFHLTEQGRGALSSLSRDPANRDGYLADLSRFEIDPIAESYISEALVAFNAAAPKAAAVMVGVASECLVLWVRDGVVEKMEQFHQTVPKKLVDWKVKVVLGALQRVLEPRLTDMPVNLREEFDSFWDPLAQNSRLLRNDAGHPKRIDSVDQRSVHATLLLFPRFAELASDLRNWVATSW